MYIYRYSYIFNSFFKANLVGLSYKSPISNIQVSLCRRLNSLGAANVVFVRGFDKEYNLQTFLLVICIDSQSEIKKFWLRNNSN